jgi:hypothetical protein
LEGSYECSCNEGYKLDTKTNQSCIAIMSLHLTTTLGTSSSGDENEDETFNVVIIAVAFACFVVVTIAIPVLAFARRRRWVNVWRDGNLKKCFALGGTKIIPMMASQQ